MDWTEDLIYTRKEIDEIKPPLSDYRLFSIFLQNNLLISKNGT